MVDHARNAAAFVSDIERTRWHDQALWFVRQKRDRAARSVPEWEKLRESAQKVKSHTLAHLGHYLERFEANARANGIDVRWAADGAALRRIVAEILKEHGAVRVVKSKSMLTEECGLNPHLQSLGIEVTDTDLGERIVQLAGDHPSHIVLPAIHMKKEDVAALFSKHLHTDPGNADAHYLTRAAREHLRQKFLEADAAITGVNFALAEEGGFVVCTNEGNADLGTALPNLHIACMGLEKVIPSAKQLGVFTRLLARSATGQAITTYTSHFMRPKPGGRLVVVIVDNGRSRLLKGRQAGALSCIRCGACMNTCPVYRRSGGHSYGTVVPGPIGSVLAGASDVEKFASLPFACSLCASCDNVCPVRIDLHARLCDEREEAIAVPDYAGKRAGLKMAAFLLRHPKLYEMLMGLARAVLPRLPRGLLYNRFNLWGREREMPIPAKKAFRELYRERRCRRR
ncbi:lactate utilization protein B [Hydrogenimonas urashimensis]|uniref:lactate utilization protein B n=1 Tax=Hydrogenimonas urashimensis TaxID=2740515 RepID=UPI001916A6C3|nr:lactate utilization protein B [Hydrogenimonas urashimensis]